MKKAKIIEFKSSLTNMELFEAIKTGGDYPFFLDSGMDNEKLEVQIGNTLKFFVSTYIDKEENER